MIDALDGSVSVGVATTVPALDSPPEDLLAAADRMLYRVKENGRDGYRSVELGPTFTAL